VKLASYLLHGRQSYGVISSTGIVDLGKRYGERWSTLREFLASGSLMSLQPARFTVDADLTEVDFLPVIPDGAAIFCVGLNYADHALESGRRVPVQPSTFLKLGRSLVGHGHALLRPRVSQMLDWEAELGVVIGGRARHVDEANALSSVAGYTCLNDGSVRDWQL
jgi:2-keto-4-pentenoate hydratase/2-oxohepta-3-ene-1,7-dioic acid hydratase in catechol pathway